jgi:hypothetical protein
MAGAIGEERLMFYMILIVALFLISIAALAVGGSEPPDRIMTFGRSSSAERNFERRSARWRWIGFSIFGLATLLGIALALAVGHWI